MQSSRVALWALYSGAVLKCSAAVCAPFGRLRVAFYFQIQSYEKADFFSAFFDFRAKEVVGIRDVHHHKLAV